MTFPHDYELIQLRSAVTTETVSVDAALLRMLDHPIGFPTIDQAIVPGDRIAIAMLEGVPEARQVLEATLAWLAERLASKEVLCTVVLPSKHEWLAESIRLWLTTHWPNPNRPTRETETGDRDQAGDLSGEGAEEQIGHKVVCHAPDEQDQLEYVAASEVADPIYLQRDLVEADLVLPIYRWFESNDPRGHDPYVVLPGFGDRITLRNHGKAWLHRFNTRSKPSAERPLRSTSVSGWLIGIQFAIGVVANGEGQVGFVAAGDPEQVAEACRISATGTETRTPAQNDRKAISAGIANQSLELVVVNLVSKANTPTWTDIASAVWSAERWLAPSGRVVVVAQELEDIPSGIQALASDEPDEEIQQMLLDGSLEESFPAAVLRSIQSRRSIYIQSKIDPELLESLGFACISDAAGLNRLIQTSRRVGMLEY